MSRSRGTKTERDRLRGYIYTRVYSLMDARTAGLGTCSFGPTDVYKAMFSPVQHAAIEALMPDIFETTRTMSIRAKHPHSKGKYESFSMAMPSSMPWPTCNMQDDRMDPTFYQIFIEWAERRVRVQQEANRVKYGVQDVLNAATTYGQIRALWPSMELFMPPAMREQLTRWKKSKASDVVRGAWEMRTNNLTTETAEHWLTEALLFEGATDETNDPFSVY